MRTRSDWSRRLCRRSTSARWPQESPRDGGALMEEVAEVYARALFGAAKDADVLDEVHEQLGQFAQALNDSRDLMQFLFSPYFSSEEKKDALGRAIKDADPRFVNFLEALIERHRMPVLFRIRDQFEQLWA